MINHDLIDAYFEGNLTTEETQLLEMELRNNAAFAEEMALQKAIRKTIHLKEREALKAELKSFQKTTKIVPLKTWFAAAAVLLIGVCTWVYVSTQKPQPDLYVAYYQPFPNVINPNVRGENVRDKASAAFAAYDTEAYPKAEKLFEELYQSDSSDYSYFYWGMCQLQNDKTTAAIATFRTANYTEKERWQAHNDWYLALAYIKNNETEKAKILLNSLVKTNGLMATEAAKLLGEL